MSGEVPVKGRSVRAERLRAALRREGGTATCALFHGEDALEWPTDRFAHWWQWLAAVNERSAEPWVYADHYITKGNRHGFVMLSTQPLQRRVGCRDAIAVNLVPRMNASHVSRQMEYAMRDIPKGDANALAMAQAMVDAVLECDISSDKLLLLEVEDWRRLLEVLSSDAGRCAATPGESGYEFDGTVLRALVRDFFEPFSRIQKCVIPLLEIRDIAKADEKLFGFKEISAEAIEKILAVANSFHWAITFDWNLCEKVFIEHLRKLRKAYSPFTFQLSRDLGDAAFVRFCESVIPYGLMDFTAAYYHHNGGSLLGNAAWNAYALTVDYLLYYMCTRDAESEEVASRRLTELLTATNKWDETAIGAANQRYGELRRGMKGLRKEMQREKRTLSELKADMRSVIDLLTRVRRNPLAFVTEIRKPAKCPAKTKATASAETKSDEVGEVLSDIASMSLTSGKKCPVKATVSAETTSEELAEVCETISDKSLFGTHKRERQFARETRRFRSTPK